MADKYLKIRLDEETLAKLQEVAKSKRRDTHSHVLWLIDRELGNENKGLYVKWLPSTGTLARSGDVFDEATGRFVTYNQFHSE